MNENITRIADLPDNNNQIQLSNVEMGLPNSYIPMNIHPNPYGNNNNNNPSQTSNFSQLNENNANTISQEQKTLLDNMPYNRLPSRDIKLDISQYSNDEQIQNNYIPRNNNTHDYIREHENITEKKIDKHNQDNHKKRLIDTLFTEIQTPLLIALLFFIFQMPFINHFFNKNLSFLNLYNQDGNINFNGLLLKSSFFGLFYYLTIKASEIISEL